MNPIEFLWRRTFVRAREFLAEAKEDMRFVKNAMREDSDQWEDEYTAEWDHRDAECPGQPARMKEAEGARHDPGKAFEIYLAAAEDGSVWSMWMIGWHYDVGLHVTRSFDMAERYYCEAVGHGSMRAALSYAQLLRREKGRAAALEILAEPVRKNYLPAYFWYSTYAYGANPTKATAREIQPFLNEVADAGHPYARYLRSQLMVRGKFGPANIIRGMRQQWALVKKYFDDE